MKKVHRELQRVTGGYRRLKAITKNRRGYKGYMGLQGVTVS